MKKRVWLFVGVGFKALQKIEENLKAGGFTVIVEPMSKLPEREAKEVNHGY